MESLASPETQEVLKLKRRILAREVQSEGYPHPQNPAAERGTMPLPNHANSQLDSNSNIAPFDFTFTTQSPRRAVPSQDHNPPHLRAAQSFPTTHLADHERVKVDIMHYTFAGYPDGSGDTQPMDTQTFVLHSDLGASRSIIGIKAEPAQNEEGMISHSAAAETNGYRPVNLEQGEMEIDDDVSSIGSDEDELSPETNLRIQAHTGALFKMPQTPATVSRKRNFRGEIISSEIRTSSTKAPASVLRAMFGNNMGAAGDISMTQLFRNTQVGSSPLPNAPQSDPVFERPSPNMHLNQSSPRIMPVSSPIRPSTSDGTRHVRYANIEPVSVYRTMKESQESRAAKLREEEEKRMRDVLEEEEDEFDDDSWVLAQNRRKKHELLRKEAVTNCVALTAPRRPNRRASTTSPKQGRSKSMIDISSDRHITSDAKNMMARMVSSDPVTDTLDILNSTDLPDTQYEDELAVEEENREELGVHVKERIQVPMTSSKPLRRSQIDSIQNSPSRSRDKEIDNTPTQKSIAIQDSQMGVEHFLESIDISQGIAIPSSAVPNRIMQSPYASLTSETRAMISQNMRAIQEGTEAAPVQLSAPVATEDEIPSSPPLLPKKGNEAEEGFVDELALEEIDLLPSSVPQQMTAKENKEPEMIPDATERTNSPCPMASNDTRDPKSSLTHANSNSRNKHTIPASSGTELWETAKTDQSPPLSTRRQQAQNSPFSPIKRLADIAAEPSPRRSNESFNIDFDILTDGDREYLDVMSGSSPVRPSKRPRLYGRHRSVLRDPSVKENVTNATKAVEVVQPEENESATEKPAPSTEDDAQLPEREPSQTPPAVSTKQKEKQGAKAALRARAIAASRNLTTVTNNVNQLENLTSKPGKVVKHPAPKATKRSAKGVREQTPAAQTDVEQISSIVEEVATDRVPSLTNSTTISSGPITAPHRVLALFKDAKLYYYPATFLEAVSTSEGEKLKLRFDDDTVAIVDPMQVRKFELVVGDSVKVDLNGMRKGTYVVHDFDSSIEVSRAGGDGANSLTDAFGHKTVKLIHRASESLPTPATAPSEPVVVSVDRLYLTGGMLPQFANRKFTLPSKGQQRFATPSITPSEPTTPSSRTRRNTMSVQAPEVELLTRRIESDLFTNMSFAVTFVKDPEGKEAVNKLITANAGTLLDHGFHELFDPRALESTSPRKSPRRITITETEVAKGHKPLRLKSSAQKLGFTALISDRHCRSQKYLQALALGIPCLHHRWLTDCITSSSILPFEKYLLPAGESNFLSGAVRSRHLVPYDPRGNNAELEGVLGRRQLLLKNAKVLLVMSTVERRKAYQFLAFALGATNVTAVKNLEEGKKISEDMEWLFVDGDCEKAREALLGNKGGGNSKKRKRGSDASEVAKAKVADSEFVVQSLILGGLADY